MAPRPGLDELMRRRTTGDRGSDPTRWLAEMAAPGWVDLALMYVAESVLTGARHDGGELRLRRTASVGRDPGLAALFPEERPVRWERGTPTLRALARGETVHLAAAGRESAARLAVDLDDPRLAEVVHTRMVLLLPLLDSGRLVGAALLLAGVPLAAHRLDALAELARWTGQALAAGRELRDRLAFAAELERGVLPPEEARRPGLEVATRLRNPLDGHWCDVLELPGGLTGLVVGETGGPGPRAAARLLRLRAQIQALALAEPMPGRLLELLDRLVRQPDEAVGECPVSCLYAVFEPASGEFRFASAGRVTSILVGPDGSAEPLESAPAPPLGTGHPSYPTRFCLPEPGSLLLLGTRGLTLVGDGLLGVGRPPSGAPRLTEPSEFTGIGGLSGLCERLAKGAGRDPVALLAVRLPAPEGVEPESASPAPGRRRAPESEFVGRTSELHEVRRMLEDARLVTVTGAPGIGKSRLAAEAAADLDHDFPDGVVRVDLSAVRSPARLPNAVEEALRATAGLSLVEIADRRLLLVLDEGDHLVDSCSGFVRSLLRAAPQLRVLSTGRQPFGLAGEHVLPLEPLGLDAAARLFVSLAGPRPADEDPADVRRLCARLDALPLMVELAARAAADGASAAELAARFDELGDFAGFGDEEAAEAVRASVERSHGLCTGEERLLWARLAVFDGRFDLYAVERVCVDERLNAEEMLPVLQSLIVKSVVASELGPRGRGYRLLHGVRGLGREMLARLPEQGALFARRDAWLAGAEGGR